MKVILKAFGIFEREYEAPIKREGQDIFFIHRNRDHLFSMMKEVPSLDKIPERVMRKAKFTWEGKYDDELPIYEFQDLE